MTCKGHLQHCYVWKSVRRSGERGPARYHNHGGSSRPLTVSTPLISSLPRPAGTVSLPKSIQMDFPCWVDPIAYMQKHKGRHPLVHVKDFKRAALRLKWGQGISI